MGGKRSAFHCIPRTGGNLSEARWMRLGTRWMRGCEEPYVCGRCDTRLTTRSFYQKDRVRLDRRLREDELKIEKISGICYDIMNEWMLRREKSRTRKEYGEIEERERAITGGRDTPGRRDRADG